MSEPAFAAPSPAPPPGPRELLVKYAQKGGGRVALLRCVDFGTHTQVDCDVYPAGRPAAEPQRAGPYIFATPGEAVRFVDEATLALEYLGCDIS